MPCATSRFIAVRDEHARAHPRTRATIPKSTPRIRAKTGRHIHERTWSELASIAGADAPAAVSRARTTPRGLADAARRCVEMRAIGAAMEDVDAIIVDDVRAS